MKLSIEDVVMQFKHDVGRALQPEFITAVCHALGHVWRDRQLGPVTTIQGFLLQILHGNIACSAVPRLLGKAVSGEAYGQARSRLPLELFQRLLAELCSRLHGYISGSDKWLGHRVWVLDGSSCSMPDVPALQQAFGQPAAQASGCGFPVAHLMALFHVQTGMLLRIAAAPMRTHDQTQARRMHEAFAAGDVLLADRGFCSYWHLAQLSQARVHAVFRIHQKQIVSFRKGRMHVPPSPPFPERRDMRGLPTTRWIRWLGRRDQVVEYHKPSARPKWMSTELWESLPATLTLRELRYRVEMRGVRTREITLATTLLDSTRYPAAELAALYGRRWEVETNLRHLKQALGMDILHTKSVEGVQKELAMFAIVYNLVRVVMMESAKYQDVAPDRISFTDALRWLRAAGHGGELARIRVNPERPGRIEPRVLKRRPKKFPLMKKPRSELKQLIESKKLTS